MSGDGFTVLQGFDVLVAAESGSIYRTKSYK